MLERNKKECKATGAEPWILFGNRHDIRKIRSDGSEYKVVTSGLKGIVGIDFDVADNYVYYTDVISEVIKRTKLDQLNSSETLVQHLHTPDGLTIDWVGRKMYWTDTGLKKIEVADLDGKNNMELLTVELAEPRAVACDPNEG